MTSPPSPVWHVCALGGDRVAVGVWLERLKEQLLSQMSVAPDDTLARACGLTLGILHPDALAAHETSPPTAPEQTGLSEPSPLRKQPDLVLIASSDASAGALRAQLIQRGWAFTVIDDWGHAGLRQAEDLLALRLRTAVRPGSGLFSRLEERDEISRRWRWTCDTCDDPDCEHALREAARGASSVQTA